MEDETIQVKLQGEIEKINDEIQQWEETQEREEYIKQMQQVEDEMESEYKKIIAEMQNVVKANKVQNEEHKKQMTDIDNEEEGKKMNAEKDYKEKIKKLTNDKDKKKEEGKHQTRLKMIKDDAKKERDREDTKNDERLKEIYDKAKELNNKEIDTSKVKELKNKARTVKKDLESQTEHVHVKDSDKATIIKIQDDVKEFKIKRRKQWDEYYMKIACLAALRSKDPKTLVGACIVDRENGQIVGIGFNSMPKDKYFSWKGASSRSGNNPVNPKLKYAYVVHAAVNAILNKTRESIKGCTLYTTLHPDEDCAHAMIQAEIKEVVYCTYTRKDELDPDQKKAQVIFEIKKVQYRKLPKDNLEDDKYVKELQRRIDQGKKQKENAEREPEPATVIPPEKFFMRMAKLSQKRPGNFQNKAVGACIATPYKQIVAVEYSGEPEGIQLEIRRKAEELHPGLDTSNLSSFFVHAEYRAIVGRSVRGCTLYVTSYPCNVCAKMIVQSGIKEVVYYKDGDWNDDRCYSSREILTSCLGPSNIRKYGSGDSKNESQDQTNCSIAIEEPGRTYMYIRQITILQYIIIILVLLLVFYNY